VTLWILEIRDSKDGSKERRRLERKKREGLREGIKGY